jgi:hypothetical protein
MKLLMKKSSRKTSRKNSKSKKHSRKLSRPESREHTSTLTFKHENVQSLLKDGVVTTLDEKILDGSTGMTFKLYSKKNDKILKIVGGSKGDKFYFNVTETGKDDIKLDNITKKDVVDALKKYDNVKFILDYLK